MCALGIHAAWDRGVRIFHWINFLCVLGLLAVGTVILNAGALGVSDSGKILLKTVHVLIGYVFAINLLWRVVWGFVGGRYARWRAILPVGRGYFSDLRRYLGGRTVYVGHNPLGRIAVTVLLLLLANQAITGLVLAGTDLFYPPLGFWIAGWIAAAGVDPGSLVPGARDMFDETAYQDMRALRKPVITAHLWGFYTLLVFIALHIAAVIVTELREDSGLISAMFTGRKVLRQIPEDAD